MKTTVLITMFLIGAAFILSVPLFEFLAAQNTQNNLVRIMTEKSAASANVQGFSLDSDTRTWLFRLGAIVIGVATFFTWYNRTPVNGNSKLHS